MLAQIRAFAKSPIAMGILGLLVLSFLVFGIGDVFRNGSIKDSVVQAGSRSVSSPQFKQRFDSFKKQIETQQNNGQPITVEQAAAAGIDKALVDQLAVSESLAELFRRIGLIPSDKLVVSELRKNPSFFDQVTGKFDRPTYQARLQGAGMTEPEFEGVLRDETAQTHFVSGLASGLVVPRTYLASLATYAREGRDFTAFTLPPTVAGPADRPTDADLAAYVKANAPIFTKPELRTFTLVRFSPSLLAPTLKIDEAAVQKRFDFEKDTLSLPETRSFVQVPVKDAAAAAQAVARLKAGEDPAAVAKGLGVQTVAYVDVPKTGVSDRKIADAAFALKAGDVAGPVQGSLGLQVLKVTKADPGHKATLEEARPKIEAEVRKDAATEKVYELVQKYEDARSGGATLAEAAAKVGAQAIPVPVPITAQGADLAGRSLNAPPKLMQSVFSLPEKGESDVLDLGEGEYAAVRVDKVMPSGLASLDEVRTAATQRYILEGMTKRIKAKADEIEARIKKGEPMAQAAASVGAKLEEAKAVRRDAAGKAYSNDLVSKIFQAKPGQVVVGQGNQLGYVVARLDRVVPPVAAELVPLMDQQAANFRNSVFDDVSEAARNAARAEVKPKVDYNRARTAIGLEAQAPPAPAAKK
ncbi:MAG TPA: peptidyl-prolyl cis-trans isomerase [Caulobacteraceae bacterium]|jgi:peptidyl-prolyl cis-trans isomerase D|nr:peptidyl-prolyl cis-trans isomerase [Caulobacteraceae bacterium]